MKKFMTKLLSAILCMAMVMGYTATADETEVYGFNVAKISTPYLYKPDLTGLLNASAGKVATYAIDGNPDTVACAGGSFHWALVLDLGELTEIERIAFTLRDNCFPTNYDVLIRGDEEGALSENLYRVGGRENNTEAGLHEYTFMAYPARYVIIRDNVPQPGVRQMQIAEIEVNEPVNEEIELDVLVDAVKGEAKTDIAPGAKPYFYNSALTKTLVASAGRLAEYANDGNWSTVACAGGEYNWTLVMDLGEETEINRIALEFAENGFPTDFDVLIKKDDGAALRKNLYKLVSVTGNDVGGIHAYSFEPQTARYVIIRDNVPQPGVRQMQVREIEINEVREETVLEDVLLESVTMNPGKNVAKEAKAWLYDTGLSVIKPAKNWESPDAAKYADKAIDNDPESVACVGGTWNWALMLDLREEKEINRIAVTFAEGGYPTDFDVLIKKDDGTALRKNLYEVASVTENDKGGLYEFNFKPLAARYVIIRDNVPQTNVRQMQISNVEVNEAADFYVVSEESGFDAAYEIKSGKMYRMISNNPELAGNKSITALYDKNGKLVSVSAFNEVCFDGAVTNEITVPEGITAPVDYSRQNPTVWLSDINGNSLNANIAYEYNVPGYHDNARPWQNVPTNAIDGTLDTFACAGGAWNWTFNMDFGEEKTVSVVNLNLVNNGYPTDFDIVAIDAEGNSKTVASVTGNDKAGEFNFEFDPVSAKIIKVVDKVAQPGINQMRIGDIHVYDKAWEYEMKSFMWSDENGYAPVSTPVVLR